MSDYNFENGVWSEGVAVIDKDGNESIEYHVIPITEVPIGVLIEAWEDIVLELSEKEIELYNLKEAYLIAERKIIEETNFKELYGANNEKVRTNHVKTELSDMVEQKASLQFSIDFLNRYIPLVKQVIYSQMKVMENCNCECLE